MGEFIHRAFASKMICGRGEPAIGTLPQRRFRFVELDALIRNNVRNADSRAARIVVVKFPRGQRAVRRDPAADIDHSSGTEVGPRKFFFARPNEFDWMAGVASEARGFDRRVARVLAAVRGAGVWNDDADFFFREMKCVGEFLADAERPLRTGPDGDAAVFPLGDRGARLERSVRDVFDGVGLRELVRGLRDSVVD